MSLQAHGTAFVHGRAVGLHAGGVEADCRRMFLLMRPALKRMTWGKRIALPEPWPPRASASVKVNAASSGNAAATLRSAMAFGALSPR
jgi:hypothetical protein